jgi:hypothetical protein
MAAPRSLPDWSTDSRSHVFPSVPGGINTDVAKILTWLKEYDETCQEARAQMIKKIDDFLGIEPPQNKR